MSEMQRSPNSVTEKATSAGPRPPQALSSYTNSWRRRACSPGGPEAGTGPRLVAIRHRPPEWLRREWAEGRLDQGRGRAQRVRLLERTGAGTRGRVGRPGPTRPPPVSPGSAVLCACAAAGPAAAHAVCGRYRAARIPEAVSSLWPWFLKGGTSSSLLCLLLEK